MSSKVRLCHLISRIHSVSALCSSLLPPTNFQRPLNRMVSNDWLSMLCRFDWTSSSYQRQFRQRLLKNKDGLPVYLLGCFWERLLLSTGSPIDLKTYTSLLEVESFKFETEIKRDVHRTFPELKFFKERGAYGQRELYNVLKAFSIHNAEVGYCQGMGFITGLLLSYMSELDSFNCLVTLMSEEPDGSDPMLSAHKMGGLYKPGLPMLVKYLGALQRGIESELPKLFAHFQNLGIEISMFGSQWILSLFIYNLSFPKAVALFNLFLFFGYKIILLFGIHILEKMQNDILSSDFEGALSIINNIDVVVHDIRDFINWLEDEGGWDIPISELE
jgi:uncharacterized protein YjfI (DUF2170 family)